MIIIAILIWQRHKAKSNYIKAELADSLIELGPIRKGKALVSEQHKRRRKHLRWFIGYD